jgi:hypothetical protein
VAAKEHRGTESGATEADLVPSHSRHVRAPVARICPIRTPTADAAVAAFVRSSIVSVEMLRFVAAHSMFPAPFEFRISAFRLHASPTIQVDA